MSLRTSATRYAKALFDVALQESDPVRIERDLAAVVETIAGRAELRRGLTHPRVPEAVRVELAQAVADQVDAKPPVARLLALLAARRRLELLSELLAVYRERLLAHRHVVRAQVTSAAPLSSDSLRALERSLGDLTGKHVEIDAAVDPALVGGLVARIGSTVYDGSVQTQLAKMKQQLIETA